MLMLSLPWAVHSNETPPGAFPAWEEGVWEVTRPRPQFSLIVSWGERSAQTFSVTSESFLVRQFPGRETARTVTAQVIFEGPGWAAGKRRAGKVDQQSPQENHGVCSPKAQQMLTF